MADAGRRSVAVRLTVTAVITGHGWFYQAGAVEIAAAQQVEARVAGMKDVCRPRLNCRAGRGRAQVPPNGVSNQRSECVFVHVC
jgi:hypothetical protein